MSKRRTQNSINGIELGPTMVYSPIILEDSFDDNSPSNDSLNFKDFRPYISDYPTVYILYSDSGANREAYIGETTHLKARLKSHLKTDRKKLDRMVAIGCKTFNQSATYNIESNLISSMLADEVFVLQNRSQVSEDFTVHNYYQKEYYNDKLFEEIWKELIETGIAKSQLNDIKNRDVYKLSPYKQLTNSQFDLVNAVTTFCINHINDDKPAVFLIKGEAGTGKSVVLSCLYKKLVDMTREKSTALYDREGYLLVNHSEQFKTYLKIADGVKGLKKKGFLKPTTFINKAKSGAIRSDFTIVDEAHLLLSQKDAYNNFHEDNHLEEIIRYSKITIVVYDEKQVLKLKSYWDKQRLNAAIASAGKQDEFILREQCRMIADEDTLKWVDAFVEHKKLLPLTHLVEGRDTKGFEFLVFDDAKEMHKAIKAKDAEQSLARMVATFDYEHKKDGALYYVEEGSLRLPWNVAEGNTTWAERSETIDEVGSIYTVQGFDLNYVGVILGPSVAYDVASDAIVIRTENYMDTEAFKGRSDIEARDIPHIKEQIVLNSINVLMKRGMKGLYVYAHDAALRERLVMLTERTTCLSPGNS